MNGNPTTPPGEDVPVPEVLRVRLQPGDVGVLIHPRKLTQEAKDRIRAEWESRFPHNDVLVLCEGMKLANLSAATDDVNEPPAAGI